MKLDYNLLQSTDDDAFTLLMTSNKLSTLPAQSEIASAPQSSKDGAMKRSEIRKRVLEAVESRARAKDGLGRIKGKVGVITGVGPEMGIGVSLVSSSALDGEV